jgi:prepilin-type N-terminal cleavage/methylation domain-containing protein
VAQNLLKHLWLCVDFLKIMKNNQSLKQKKSGGFSIIELLIVVVVIGIIAAIAVPNLLKSRRAANEASAITSVRVISREEVTFRFSGGTDSFGTMAELYAGKFLHDELGAPPNIKQGFSFAVQTIAPTSSTPPKYTIQANPVIHSLTNVISGTGARNFGANESGVIYQTLDNTPVTFDDTTRLPTGSTIILQN